MVPLTFACRFLELTSRVFRTVADLRVGEELECPLIRSA
jgi:hypothetical protein